jgi:hypothetical protein
MQIAALSQIVWLQLVCIALYPMFFNQINVNNDLANIVIYVTGLLMLSYLLLRNFAFNDAKYKTKLLFGILPVTTSTIIGARGIIVYVFCIIATPLLILFSRITHAIKPETFAVFQTHILPYGLLLVAIFIPIEFLIFYMFETQKADIIGALAIFPYMALMAFIYNFIMNSPLLIGLIAFGIFLNMFCYIICKKLYKCKVL